MRIRLEGTEKEVINAMDALEMAKVVNGVSRVYPNRGSQNLVRMYAQEIQEGRLVTILGYAKDFDITPKFGDGLAGWYGWARCEMEDVDREGPFETEKEAIRHAKFVVSELKEQGKRAMELWELCDKDGVHFPM